MRRPLRIGIDLTAILPVATGVDNYLQELVLALGRVDRENRYTLFVNLEDPSALAQWVVDYDWRQNLQLLAALNLPIGPTGTEYGGIETPVEGRYLATGAGVFIQLAAYF